MVVPRIAGVLLAAGLGRRFGMPKALADSGDGPWVLRALRSLDGLAPRIVVVGAQADRVAAMLPDDVIAAHNPDYASGMASSLVAGLAALDPGVDAAVVMLVDLPDVTAAAVDRVTAAGRDAGIRTSLARATYDGVPGHPVLLGADHIAGVVASAGGDHGARDYLAEHDVTTVECADLGTGRDVDTADDDGPAATPPGPPPGRGTDTCASRRRGTTTRG